MPKDFKTDGPLAGYRPLPGVADELMDPSGAVRRAWWGFIDHFAKLAPDEIAARFAKGDQYLYDAGVFYRQYGETGSTERDWPLSHIPVLIHDSEWQGIAAGLIQRADLLEDVVADLYGENRLVAEGHLPASLIGMSDEWLRPLVGVAPRSGHYLNFIAFEIGRGPDGNWWVLGDRTQAPSGAGFALENRVATSRVFADLYPEANVHRLAGFFQTFRDSLRGLRHETDSQVAILTPGLFSETYFEHAYIARYLGFMLLEGEDLTVEHGKVMVRTVEGLAPISVLWRRLDAAFADPLELNDHSRLGTPGLVEAVRQGNVTMVNALGAGVLETRALLAFLPRISRALRNGAPLALPNIATWWCGQAAEREHVRANAAHMVIGPALSTRLPYEPDETAAAWKAAHSHAADNIGKLLDSEGALLVGQETVTLSTTPAYVDGKLVPRPMSLRVFLARGPGGWQVMPGGYARIGRTEDAAAVAMQAGGSAADVWIVSDQPVETHTMLPARAASFQRAAPSALPSRAADNLYWLGRYVERAEHSMRLLRAYHLRIAEAVALKAPILEDLREHLEIYGVDPVKGVPDQLTSTLSSAIRSASQVRDRFSVDGWMALNDLDKTARALAARVAVGDDAARAMRVLLRKINGFSGLVHENMYHSMGWRFLTIGRSLERAVATASMLASFADPAAPEGALDLAVELADSAMTHRSRYAVATNRNTVIDLLVFDSMNPRAILYHLTELREQVNHLPGALVHRQMSPMARAALQAHASLAVRTPETLDSEALLDLRGELASLSELLSSTYMK